MHYYIKKAIPNTLTSLNLLSGCLAAYFAFNHFFLASLVFCLIGVFFDFFDGFFARILKVEDNFGKQLDSLADIVTSGFVPGIIMYQLFLLSGVKEISYSINFKELNFIFSIAPIALFGFLITVGSAFRLAKFNLSTYSLSHFNGLPAPSNSILIVSLPSFIAHPLFVDIKPYILNSYSLSIIVLTSVFLMNVKWKMFKIKLNRGKYIISYPIVLIVISGFLILFLREAGLTLVIIIYLLLCLVKNLINKD